MKGRFALTTAVLAALSGCAEEVREPGTFFGDGCILDTEAAPCDDCIEFAHVTRLGSDELGPGYLVDTGTMDNVVRDGQGNYWVGQNEEIKVFGPDGVFLRTVGRRGVGPMEFRGAAPTHVDSAGRVHVFDPLNVRISVIGPDWTLAEEIKLPTWVSAEAPLDGGDRYVVQALIEERGRTGMPLHIVDGSEILKSFGEKEPDEEFSLGSIDLRLASGPEGRVFAAHPVKYMIEAWSQEGTRVGALRGEPQLNTEASLQEPPSPDNPLPSGGIFDIHADSDGLLWVSLLILRPDWLRHIMWDPSGAVSSEVTQEVLTTRIYQPRLDVIDLATCTLVGSRSAIRVPSSATAASWTRRRRRATTALGSHTSPASGATNWGPVIWLTGARWRTSCGTARGTTGWARTRRSRSLTRTALLSGRWAAAEMGRWSSAGPLRCMSTLPDESMSSTRTT